MSMNKYMITVGGTEPKIIHASTEQEAMDMLYPHIKLLPVSKKRTAMVIIKSLTDDTEKSYSAKISNKKNIIHYNGELGVFDYDPEVFQIKNVNTTIGDETRTTTILRYKGTEIRGSKIKIPKGIVDCNGMFYGANNLITPPVIPNSVKHCDGMFVNCRSLIRMPKIPIGVETCAHMFYKCYSLSKVTKIPYSVTDCYGMFDSCTKLKETPIIETTRACCEYMFNRCSSLKRITTEYGDISKSNNIFNHCSYEINMLWDIMKVNPGITFEEAKIINYMIHNHLLF